MDNENKFNYTYAAPTESERREIESIKKQYVSVPKSDGKLDLLRKLNKRVNRPPLVVAWIMGIVGVLVTGLGMTMVLEWNLTAWGIAVGMFGIAVAAVAYPVYKAIIAKNKRKYGQRIIELSNELLNENKDE